MSSLILHPLLQVTPEQISSKRESLDLDEKKIQKGIDAIIEWWEKQEHLVEILPHTTRGIIERIIIISQGSLESSKRRIDKIYTTRALLPDIMLNKSYEEFENFLENIFVLVQPKSNSKDNTRITILNIMTENYQDFNFMEFTRYIFFAAEFRTFFEYIFSDRYILDLKNAKAHMLTKVNPIILKKGETMITGAYGIKIKGIHIINAPTFVDKLVFILKQVLKEKIRNRIYIHSSYEELYEFIDKDALPEDYGGNGPSCKKLLEQWKAYFKTEEATKIIEASNKFCSNESKRTNFELNEEYLGLPVNILKLYQIYSSRTIAKDFLFRCPKHTLKSIKVLEDNECDYLKKYELYRAN